MSRRDGKTDLARRILAERISAARPDEKVTSVSELARDAGGLSTGATVRVLGEAISQGYLVSTRGPNGAYWRTHRAAPTSDIESGFSRAQRELLEAINTAQRGLADAVDAASRIAAPTPLPSATAMDDDGLIDIDIPRTAYKVCAIADLAQLPERSIEHWPTERDFLTADPRRHQPNFIQGRLRDGSHDPAAWVLKHCPNGELYAYRSSRPRGATIPAAVLDDHGRDRTDGNYAGDLSGPCWRLGTLPQPLLPLVDRPGLINRPGGVAWVYGRVHVINQALRILQESGDLPPSDLVMNAGKVDG